MVVRLDPPPVPGALRTVPAAARAALLLAIGPGVPNGDPDDCLQWAERLRVLPRLLARHPEVFDRVAADRREELRSLQRSLVAQGMLRVEASRRLEDLAREAGLSLVFLKGTELLRRGVARIEARPVADIDLLMPAAETGDLYRILVDQGFEQFEEGHGHREHHHLRPLTSEWSGVVEIHRRVPGVGERGTYEELEGLGLIGGEAGERRMTGAGLAAHCVAHLLDQERWSPWNATLGPALGDLVDLGWGVDGPSREDVETVVPGVADDVERLMDLVEALRGGRVPEPEEAGGEILTRTVAAILSPGYRRSVRRRAFLDAVLRRDWRRVVKGLRRGPLG